MRKIIFLLLLITFCLPPSIYATQIDLANTFFQTGRTQHLGFQTIYTPIIGLVYIVAGIIVLFSFLYAGFKILQGNPKSLDEGRMIIVYAFGGIILLVSVYWITEILGSTIGTNPGSGSTGPVPPPVAGGSTPTTAAGPGAVVFTPPASNEVTVAFAQCTNQQYNGISTPWIILSPPSSYNDTPLAVRIQGSYVDATNTTRTLDITIDYENDVEYDPDGIMLYQPGPPAGDCDCSLDGGSNFRDIRFDGTKVKSVSNVTAYGYLIVDDEEDIDNPVQLGFEINTACNP